MGRSNLAPGEVLPVAVIRAGLSGFAPVHHFVESSPLSGGPETRAKRGGAFFNIDEMVHFVDSVAGSARTHRRT
jgi:hypothetical protein